MAGAPPGCTCPDETGVNRRRRDTGFTPRTAVCASPSVGVLRFNSLLARVTGPGSRIRGFVHFGTGGGTMVGAPPQVQVSSCCGAALLIDTYGCCLGHLSPAAHLERSVRDGNFWRILKNASIARPQAVGRPGTHHSQREDAPRPPNWGSVKVLTRRRREDRHFSRCGEQFPVPIVASRAQPSDGGHHERPPECCGH
jgi:hypothetical protein